MFHRRGKSGCSYVLENGGRARPKCSDRDGPVEISSGSSFIDNFEGGKIISITGIHT